MKKLLEFWRIDGIWLLPITFFGVVGVVALILSKNATPVQYAPSEKPPQTFRCEFTARQEIWGEIVEAREEAIEEALRIEAEIQEAERLVAEANERVWTAITNYTSSETVQNYIWYAWECFSWYGWSAYDLDCLITLWHRESGWSASAHNSSSGAHGIPQSLPAEKMASHGSDYWDNGYTQIRWGLDYIAGRYGNPANALAHSYSVGWY